MDQERLWQFLIKKGKSRCDGKELRGPGFEPRTPWSGPPLIQETRIMVGVWQMMLDCCKWGSTEEVESATKVNSQYGFILTQQDIPRNQSRSKKKKTSTQCFINTPHARGGNAKTRRWRSIVLSRIWTPYSLLRPLLWHKRHGLLARHYPHTEWGKMKCCILTSVFSSSTNLKVQTTLYRHKVLRTCLLQ